MAKFKAWNASNSKAIAKFHNAEIGHFGLNTFIHELIRGSSSIVDAIRIPGQARKSPHRLGK
jgi:hypothetical protein